MDLPSAIYVLQREESQCKHVYDPVHLHQHALYSLVRFISLSLRDSLLQRLDRATEASWLPTHCFGFILLFILNTSCYWRRFPSIRPVNTSALALFHLVVLLMLRKNSNDLLLWKLIIRLLNERWSRSKRRNAFIIMLQLNEFLCRRYLL